MLCLLSPREGGSDSRIEGGQQENVPHVPHPEGRAESWLSTFSSRLSKEIGAISRLEFPKAPGCTEVSARGGQPNNPKGSREAVCLRESRNSPPPYSQIKAPEDFREKALSSSRNQLENDAQQAQISDKSVLQRDLKHKPRQVFPSSLQST